MLHAQNHMIRINFSDCCILIRIESSREERREGEEEKRMRERGRVGLPVVVTRNSVWATE